MTSHAKKFSGRRLALLAGVALCWGWPAAAQRAQLPPGAVVQPLPDQGRAAELRRHLSTLADNPRSLAALVGAGRAALSLGDYQAALTFFARAQDISPQDARVRAGMGSALIHLEQPQDALRFFAEAVSLGAPEAEVAGDRGLAHDAVGDQARAQQDYNLALRTRDDPEIRRRLALSLAISGQRDPALRTIADQVARGDRAALRVRSFILALTGDVAGAGQAAQTAMPAGAASALTPFLARLASLSPAQRAMAVHFGRFPVGVPMQMAGTPQAQTYTPPPPAVQPQRQVRPTAPAQASPTPRPRQEPPIRTAENRRRERDYSDPLDRFSRRRSVREETVQRPQATPPRQQTPGEQQRSSTTPNTAPQQPQPQVQQPVQVAQVAPQPVPQPPQQSQAQPPVVTQPQTPLQTTQLPPSSAADPAGPQLPGFTLQPGREPTAITPQPQVPANTQQQAPVEVAQGPASQPPASSQLPGFSIGPIAQQSPPPPAVPAQTTTPAPTAERPGLQDIAALVSRLPTDEPRPTAEPSPPSAQPPAQRPRAQTVPPSRTQPTTGTSQPPRGQREATTAPSRNQPSAPTRPNARNDRSASAEPQAERGRTTARERTAAAEPPAANQRGQRQQAAREPHPSRHWVQVAGGADRSTLPRAFARLREQAPAQLRNRTAYVTPLRATNRLLVGPFPTTEAAQEFVNQLARQNLSAFAWTSPAGQEIERLPNP